MYDVEWTGSAIPNCKAKEASLHCMAEVRQYTTLTSLMTGWHSLESKQSAVAGVPLCISQSKGEINRKEERTEGKDGAGKIVNSFKPT